MTDREQLIDGLRQFASFMEDNPAAPLPPLPHRFDAFLWSKDDLVKTTRLVGGKLEKHSTEQFFFLRKSFGEAVNYEINVDRETVCQKVVVGTKVIPAQPERVIPAQPEQVEEITEWRCTEILK